MTIRNIEKADIPELSRLYEQFWNERSDTDKMRTQLDKIGNMNTHILLCAVENGHLLGSVMGIVCEELYGDCRPFLAIENMIVDKECRRRGIGRALLLELEREAKAKGCAQVILVTETNRKDACGFYESMGFKAGISSGYKKSCSTLRGA
jgi:ribosomal protein S18 acetylase RimI-like enzyme